MSLMQWVMVGAAVAILLTVAWSLCVVAGRCDDMVDSEGLEALRRIHDERQY